MAISSDIFGFCNRKRGATGVQWVETRGTAKYPTMHWMVPHYNELSSSEYQQFCISIIQLRISSVENPDGQYFRSVEMWKSFHFLPIQPDPTLTPFSQLETPVCINSKLSLNLGKLNPYLSTKTLEKSKKKISIKSGYWSHLERVKGL